MVRHPDGRVRPLLFDGQPLLRSAVFLDADGRLHVGTDALRLGYADPGRLEPNPKRRVDDGSVLLGETGVPVADLFAALLGAVAREAMTTAGFLPPAVLTHPASWGEGRRSVLLEALGKAGWPAGTRLVPEPVAAARYFADVLRRPVPVGSSLAVFDFGGGTLDVAVVRNEGVGRDGRARFAVTASGGADDLGGLDLDAAIADHLGRSLAAAEPAAWRALTEPVTLAQWRARRQFWEDVRGAKEMLSRSAFAPVPVPGVEDAVHLTRDELEAVADPLVRRGVAEAAEVVAAAGLKASELAGLFLVGGSSRVPMVARLLHGELGIAPTVLEQPEMPVAEGAIGAAWADAREPVRYAAGLAPAAPPGKDEPARLADTLAEEPSLASTLAGEPSFASMPSEPFAGEKPIKRASGPGEGGRNGGGPGVAAGGPASVVAGPAAAGTGSAGVGTWAAGAGMGHGPGGADVEDERLQSTPVDPWATGEAASLPTAADSFAAHQVSSPSGLRGSGGGPAGGEGAVATPPGGAASGGSAAWPVSDSPSGSLAGRASRPRAGAANGPAGKARRLLGGAEGGEPAGSPVRRVTTPSAAASSRGRVRRPYVMILAVAVSLMLVAGAALVWVLWPGYRALDYHPLSEPRRTAAVVPVSSDWADAAIIGDRTYFASSSTETGAVGVVAVEIGATKPSWTSTKAGTAQRWTSMVALPVGVALFTDADSITSSRRIAVLGADNGALLWQRAMADDDEVHFAGDTAVVTDHARKRLIGLRLDDGTERWSTADPAGSSGTEPAVLAVTTPKDLEGPATVFGRAYEPDLGDDPRIVEIGADRSVRVLDADTGKVLTSRQNVADPHDEMVAHNGRLIVLQPNDQRIVSYKLDKLGEPAVLYTAQGRNSQMKDVTPCGDDRVCFGEEVGYDGKTDAVVALDVTGGDQVWRYPLANIDTLVPVGEAVIGTSTSGDTTLIDATGKKVWTRKGEAARLDGGNLLEFSKPLSRSPDNPAVAGRHLGDQAVPLGYLSDIRSDTCAWNTSVLACVAEKDFVTQEFAPR
nr:Hsp70 family protein [uncultured Actinoplanes sp.]